MLGQSSNRYGPITCNFTISVFVFLQHTEIDVKLGTWVYLHKLLNYIK